MTSLLVWLLMALVAGAAGFGVIALLTGRAAPMAEMPPDRRPQDLPAGRLIRADDLRAVRFDLALRGYRMAQVDAVLDRLATDLGAREEELADLRARLADRSADPALTAADADQGGDG